MAYFFSRCGVKDKVGRGAHARKKRFALQGNDLCRQVDLNLTTSSQI